MIQVMCRKETVDNSVFHQKSSVGVAYMKADACLLGTYARLHKGGDSSGETSCGDVAKLVTRTKVPAVITIQNAQKKECW